MTDQEDVTGVVPMDLASARIMASGTAQADAGPCRPTDVVRAGLGVVGRCRRSTGAAAAAGAGGGQRGGARLRSRRRGLRDLWPRSCSCRRRREAIPTTTGRRPPKRIGLHSNRCSGRRPSSAAGCARRSASTPRASWASGQGACAARTGSWCCRRGAKQRCCSEATTDSAPSSTLQRGRRCPASPSASRGRRTAWCCASSMSFRPCDSRPIRPRVSPAPSISDP